MSKLSPDEIAARIDHTALKPDTTHEKIDLLCIEAMEYGFASVCVAPMFVKQAKEKLKDSNVKVVTVVGFPLGNSFTTAKALEAETSVVNGADELDMVMNIGSFLSDEFEQVSYDIESVVRIALHSNVLVKVITETCLLNNDQKCKAADLVSNSGAGYIKTSTGFSRGGAAIEDVILLSRHTGGKIKIKAAGGIKSADFAEMLIKAGAERIGTSTGVDIIRQIKENQ